jgi:Flp pilus assembly protein TadD
VRYVRDYELEGSLLIVNTHVVAVHAGRRRAKVFDFYRSREETPAGVRLLDDLQLNAIYLNNVAVERLRSGEFARAVQLLEAAVALAPEFEEAYANLGVARRRSGDEAGALDAYFSGLALSPANPRLLNNLTSLYRSREQGIAGGAMASPATALGLVALADEHLSLGNLDRAHELYRRAHRLDPGRAEPLAGIGRMQILAGQPKRARKTLAEALALDPANLAAREMLAYLQRCAPAPAVGRARLVE